MKIRCKIYLVCFVLFAVVTFKKATSSEKENSLLMDNIEALAADETGNTALCVGSGSVDCPFTHSKVMRVYELFRLGFE